MTAELRTQHMMGSHENLPNILGPNSIDGQPLPVDRPKVVIESFAPLDVQGRTSNEVVERIDDAYMDLLEAVKSYIQGGEIGSTAVIGRFNEIIEALDSWDNILAATHDALTVPYENARAYERLDSAVQRNAEVAALLGKMDTAAQGAILTAKEAENAAKWAFERVETTRTTLDYIDERARMLLALYRHRIEQLGKVAHLRGGMLHDDFAYEEAKYRDGEKAIFQEILGPLVSPEETLHPAVQAALEPKGGTRALMGEYDEYLRLEDLLASYHDIIEREITPVDKVDTRALYENPQEVVTGEVVDDPTEQPPIIEITPKQMIELLNGVPLIVRMRKTIIAESTKHIVESQKTTTVYALHTTIRGVEKATRPAHAAIVQETINEEEIASDLAKEEEDHKQALRLARHNLSKLRGALAGLKIDILTTEFKAHARVIELLQYAKFSDDALKNWTMTDFHKTEAYCIDLLTTLQHRNIGRQEMMAVFASVGELAAHYNRQPTPHNASATQLTKKQIALRRREAPPPTAIEPQVNPGMVGRVAARLGLPGSRR